jgi:hypothetical protein
MTYQMKKNQQMTAYDKLKITLYGCMTYDEDDPSNEELICEDYNLVLPDLENCLYCSTKLLRIKGEDLQETFNGYLVMRTYCLWYCRNCRFWQSRVCNDPRNGEYFMSLPEWREYIPSLAHWAHSSKLREWREYLKERQAYISNITHWAYISKLREFDAHLPDSCDGELASFIRRNPNFLHSCNPRSFEKLVADVFKANFSNAEVLHVGKPDDGGIDVLLIDALHQQWLIQVKRRESPKHSEGVNTIRNMLGAMLLEKSLRGIVVSTANQFSLRARQAAAKAGHIGMTVRLVDKGIFNRMLDPILPDRPWLEPITQIDEELALRLMKQIHSDSQLNLFSEHNF